MKILWVLAAAIILPCAAEASIGTVSSLTGQNAQLERSRTKSDLTKSKGIESNDLVSIGSNTNAEIKFVDNTNVKITANSRLLIDDFVFDPKNSDAGRLGMKVALGSVRYASGQIAKNNPQQVSIKTPTATIAVRGTDFSMTVDETGKSMVVLLPSCTTEEQLKKFEILGNCITGEIIVSTLMGSVVLNQPFTATLVADSNTAPTPPVKVPMDLSHVLSNDSILSPPHALLSFGAERENKKKNHVAETDETRTVQNSNSSLIKTQEIEETKLVMQEAKKTEQTSVASTTSTSTNNCYPFTDCGNSQGRNYYYKLDEQRGNIISIRSGEKLDNVTYNISVNSNDIESRIAGDGTSVVTVRQWNK